MEEGRDARIAEEEVERDTRIVEEVERYEDCGGKKAEGKDMGDCGGGEGEDSECKGSKTLVDNAKINDNVNFSTKYTSVLI